MYDFHLHLARLPHPSEVASLLKQAGTSYNNIACEPWEWEKSIEMGEIRAFGIHPMIATKVSNSDWERLAEILKSHPTTQVGECGLDKRFDGYEPGGVQEQVFRRQAVLAKELGRTLHIHCVGDYQRVFSILDDLGFGETQIVLHRFGGEMAAVKAGQKFNTIFSLHMDSFRKKSTAGAIKEIPQTRVRFETDADESFYKLPEDGTEPNNVASIIASQIQNKLMQVVALYNSALI